MVSTYFNEFDKFPAAWLRALYPGAEVDERSIADVGADELLGRERCHFFAGIGGWEYAIELAGWPKGVPVWTGSCPCQPFSTAGRGLAESDARDLWPQFFRLVAACKPRYVFGEQVAGNLGLRWLDRAIADLEGDGYSCGAAVVGAHSVEAPHERQRIYWGAAADSAGERLPQPWQPRENALGGEAACFGEADRLVDAFRRGAMPFLCDGHDGVPIAVGRNACKALGNAIVPPLAAAFVSAFMEAVHAS